MPTASRPNLAYLSTTLTGLLMAVAALLGLLTNAYPTPELRAAFLTNDAINLFFGLPVLLGLLWLARQAHPLGQLLLPGALCFILYNALVYLFALPPGLPLLLALLLVMLTVFTLPALLVNPGPAAAYVHLHTRIPSRLIAGVLIGFGTLFAVRVIAALFTTPPNAFPATERGLHVADFLLSAAWILAGGVLWRRQPLGYLLGAAMLMQATLLFIALIAFLLLQPLLTPTPFALADLIVIAVMSLICLVPFVLLLRGLLTAPFTPTTP